MHKGIFNSVTAFLMVVLTMCKMGLAQDSSTKQLEAVIDEVSTFKLYDYLDYPLGRHQAELEKKHADFALAQLKVLEQIAISGLTETEQISYELLRFRLQNRVDEYKYEMYLNPIQADQGFHLNLNYRIKPILSYQDAKR
jgi:uncharacterized protein (DUF885 family)